MGDRNRVGIGLSYRPARLHSLAELIPWNRFLGSLKVLNLGSGWQGLTEGQGLFRKSEAFGEGGGGSGRFLMKKGPPQEIMLYLYYFFHQKLAGYQDKGLFYHNTSLKENIHGCS
jgi:hypothetical protein